MSRLSELLNQLKTEQGLTNPQIVEQAKRRGAKLSLGNVSNYLTGRHPDSPTEPTLVAFAMAFNVPVSELVRAAADTGREPFVPDPTADRLSESQRRLVNELIRELATTSTESSMSVPDDVMADYDMTRGQSTEGGKDAENLIEEERARRGTHP